MGTTITFKRPDGKDASGYLANAARGNAPGVVVIQEWWGLSDQIKGLCDRFALAGFDALAPDLYNGKVVPYHDTDSANNEMNSLDFMDATTQTVRGAAQYLARNGAKVGLTGFCLGGAVTIIGATKIPELAAGVVFYGIPPEQAAKPADVKIPLQAHFANKDDWCTPELVNGFEKAMKAAGKSLELFRYDAEHAFVNEQRQSVHDREAAELAWGRATEFFRKHLGRWSAISRATFSMSRRRPGRITQEGLWRELVTTSLRQTNSCGYRSRPFGRMTAEAEVGAPRIPQR